MRVLSQRQGLKRNGFWWSANLEVSFGPFFQVIELPIGQAEKLIGQLSPNCSFCNGLPPVPHPAS